MNEHDVVEFFQHILQTRFVEKRRQEYKEDPERSQEKRICKIPLDMGQGMMPAMEGVAGQMEEVPMAMEVMAEVLW
jgi:hypothetical protein